IIPGHFHTFAIPNKLSPYVSIISGQREEQLFYVIDKNCFHPLPDNNVEYCNTIYVNQINLYGFALRAYEPRFLERPLEHITSIEIQPVGNAWRSSTVPNVIPPVVHSYSKTQSFMLFLLHERLIAQLVEPPAGCAHGIAKQCVPNSVLVGNDYYITGNSGYYIRNSGTPPGNSVDVHSSLPELLTETWVDIITKYVIVIFN
ncbi:4708_t:CDS:2, partial [Rhizophagus irregularis]